MTTSRSPFKVNTENAIKISSFTDKLLTFLWNKFDLIFEKSIPEIVKDAVGNLPRYYLYCFGFISQSIAIAIFISFIYANYIRMMNSTFISMDFTAGRCQSVLKAITGTYIGSMDGYWDGSSKYKLSNSIYKFEFSNLAQSSGDFQALMNEYSDDISNIGSIAKNQTLPENLLYWATYKKSISVDGNDQVLTFTGSPAAIFNTDKFLIALGSSDYRNCSIAASTYWQPTHRYYTYNAKVEMQWAVSDYKETTCYHISTPEQFNYDSDYDGDKLTLQLDFNSYSVATATNLGIVDIEHLSPSFDDTNLYYRGRNYTYNLYFDDRFTLMDRVYCLVNSSGTDTVSSNPFSTFCFMALGKYLAIPVFNSWGYYDSSYTTHRCECPVADDSYCNNLDLLVSFIYFPSEPNLDASWTNENLIGTKLLDLALKVILITSIPLTCPLTYSLTITVYRIGLNAAGLECLQRTESERSRVS